MKKRISRDIILRIAYQLRNGIEEIHMGLKEKLLAREATLGVIGLGYVGLPLAVEKAFPNSCTGI